MADATVKNQDLSRAFEDALRGDPQTAQDLCSTYRKVPKQLKDKLGELIEQNIGGFGTKFYNLLLAIAEEHCGGG